MQTARNTSIVLNKIIKQSAYRLHSTSLGPPLKPTYGYVTINSGERVAVWSRSGRMDVVDGPKRILMFGGKVQPLARHTANPIQYLETQYKDGRKEFTYGPASIWENPVEHNSIAVKESLSINANEAMVIYNDNKGAVSRTIIRGPKLHMPKENEWIHSFSWHGSDPSYPERKRPGALKFVKLRTISDQMYYNVEQVRTSDDALITVKLMIFFELKDIDKMLDMTHDPMADFINGATADVIDFVAAHNFESFKQDIDKLNSMDTYRQLIERADRIGYEVNKVVFRGYTASSALQEMHNTAIETRTKLNLERETEEQSQSLQDFKIAKEKERIEERLKIKEMEVEHNARVLKISHDEKMRQEQEQHTNELEFLKKKQDLAAEFELANNLRKTELLQKLNELGVDLTPYLVAQAQGNPDRWIRFDGSDNMPQLHLHDSKLSK